MRKKLGLLEERIGYHFDEFHLLKNAMTHSSYVNEKHLPKYECNERLEFLGDAVLEIVSSDFLFHEHTEMPEGQLTKLRAAMVCEKSLAYCAKQIDLGEYLLLGKGEDATGGRLRDSILSDAFESVIGAIYLDGGFTSAKEFVLRFVMNDIEHKKLFFDSKTILQEKVQSGTLGELAYELIGEEGPDHNKIFTSQVRIGGKAYGTGRGRTKKLAEQDAAYRTILDLNNRSKTDVLKKD